MKTILGAGGVIGNELATLLHQQGHAVRHARRHVVEVAAGDTCVSVDLLDAEQTAQAVAGSDVAYLVAGLRYDAAVWQNEWPRVMTNAIDACRRHGTRLVFLDNVYAYGAVTGPMTEATPYNPCSKKGEVRARIATTLMEASARGDVKAMIVRAADFYGPGATLSLTHATVTERLRQKKTPQWIGNPKAVHTFSFTPDVAKSLALLAADDTAYGQVWHALTRRDPMTGETYTRMACDIAQQPYRLQVPPKFVLQAMAWFVPVIKESQEMMYQFDVDYRFDSSKLERALQQQATPYDIGIRATLAAG